MTVRYEVRSGTPLGLIRPAHQTAAREVFTTGTLEGALAAARRMRFLFGAAVVEVVGGTAAEVEAATNALEEAMR